MHKLNTLPELLLIDKQYTAEQGYVCLDCILKDFTNILDDNTITFDDLYVVIDGKHYNTDTVYVSEKETCFIEYRNKLDSYCYVGISLTITPLFN